MKTKLIIATLILLVSTTAKSQTCSPKGNETKYGSSDVWIGYVYDNLDLTSYKGYVNEGVSGNANFDESFGGSYANYSVNNCTVYTETFSVRYKLTKTFTNGTYDITVGGDDGYRLSIDGGATWLINKWVEQSYSATTVTVQLKGSYNLVLEYYENGGENRISFNSVTSCTGTENTATYGTNNVWKGYVYSGTNFANYRGMMTEGKSSSPNFDESFGGDNTTFATSGCTSVSTESFSVRYRLTKTFAKGQYTFFVGADDGYRFSLDGGSTWVINQWADQGYNVSSYSAALSGTYNMVIEYYENSGANRITFAADQSIALPIKLLSFEGNESNNKVSLDWKTAAGSNPSYFEIERSNDAVTFNTIAKVKGDAAANAQADITLTYTDASPSNGKSYYRLKMVDETGVITYSTVVVITIYSRSEGNAAITVFPTVVTNNTISIRSAASMKETEVVVYNTNGVAIAKKSLGKVQAGQVVTFNPAGNNLAKGAYFIQVSQQEQLVTTQKIIVQ
jgi:hypothetical protein